MSDSEKDLDRRELKVGERVICNCNGSAKALQDCYIRVIDTTKIITKEVMNWRGEAPEPNKNKEGDTKRAEISEGLKKVRVLNQLTLDCVADGLVEILNPLNSKTKSNQ